MKVKHKMWIGLASIGAAIATLWRKRTVRFTMELEPPRSESGEEDT